MQCYPAGKNTDKRPNPSELSYLLYYVSTRRAKLTKVGLFLDQKAQSDVYKGRAGNVQVTLDIVKNIIERCPDDLNLLAKNVVSILEAVLSSKDVSLSTHAIPVFDSFCRAHDNVLLRGDQLYVKSFQHLFANYIALAKGSTTGPNLLQWRLVGIEAIKSLAASVAVSVPILTEQIDASISILLSCLATNNNNLNLIAIQKEVADAEQNRRTSMHLERKAETDLAYAAMEAFYRFFDTTSTGLLKRFTTNVILFILNQRPPVQWSNMLLEVAATSAPVQSRFAVLTELVDYLATISVNKLDQVLTLVEPISFLLSSSVNMVGLSVIDVLRSLLHVQANILRCYSLQSLPNGKPSPNAVLLALKKCMAALASHIYYAAQVSDMISEILARCHHPSRHGLASGVVTPMRSSLPKDRDSFNHTEKTSILNPIFLISCFDIIGSILLMSLGNPAGIDRDHLTIASWDGTQHLLNNENQNVRTAYTNALITFLGCTPSHDVEWTDNESQVLDGPVGGFIAELYKLVRSETENQYLVVYHVLKAFIAVGDQTMYCACSLAILLDRLAANSVAGETQRSIEQCVAFSSISHAAVFHVGEKTQSQPLLNKIASDIELQVDQNVWFTPIDVSVARSLDEDLENAKSLSLSVEPENMKNIALLNEKLIADALGQSAPNFEPTVAQILDTNAAMGHILVSGPQDQVRISTTTNSEDSNLPSYARSLKQVNNRLHASSPGYLSPHVFAIQRTADGHYLDNLGYAPSQRTAQSNANSIAGGRSMASELDLRSEILPKVTDLKRAASGYHVRIQTPSVRGAAVNGYTKSLQSTASSEPDSAGSRAASPKFPVNGNGKIPLQAPEPQSGTLDVNNFFSSLTVSAPDRGRLF